MLFAPVYSRLRLLLDLVDVRLPGDELEAELPLLRHQLRVLRRQVKRLQLNPADRAIIAALSKRVSWAALAGMLAQTETVLGWHRQLVRRKSRRGVHLSAGSMQRFAPVRTKLS